MWLSQKRPGIVRRQKSDTISSFDVFRTAAWDDDDDLFPSAFICANCMGWKEMQATGEDKDEFKSGHGVNLKWASNGISSPWSCIKCSYSNAKSLSKCANCAGWKDGKRPAKKHSSDSGSKHMVYLPASTKKGPKPRFEVNEHVYAPWWQDRNKKTQQYLSWLSLTSTAVFNQTFDFNQWLD